ncbi:MAG: serine hydrolase domain-containing protein [Chthoniobacteraceae bacterium]|jgi:CubicO group peptidase (beta-lactamase class C family)
MRALLFLATATAWMPISVWAAGWSPSPLALDAAWDYSAEHNGYSLIVIQHRHIEFERYADGDGSRVRHKIYSGTKGLWCVAAVAAQDDGLLDLDEPVSRTITEWREEPGRGRITIRELLNFTAGIDPGFHLHSDEVTDRDNYALELPLVARPGDSFIYGPSQIQVFCEVLRRKLAERSGETPWHYLERRVLRPLGIGDVPHKVDALGNPLMAAGVLMTAREWGRFGMYLLAAGKDGEIDDCLRGSGENPAFGMGFWLNREAPSGRIVNVEEGLEPKWNEEDWDSACLCREAPRDLFVSLGSMGQRLYVVPSLDLVVVRLSGDSSFSDAEFLRLLMETPTRSM